MNAITNKFHFCPRIRSSSNRPRCPMGIRVHRIVQMGHMGSTFFERFHRRVIVRCRMSHGKHRFVLLCFNEFHCIFHFRRNSHQLYHISGSPIQLIKHFYIRLTDISPVLCTLFAGRNKRAFHVYPAQIRRFIVLYFLHISGCRFTDTL